MKIRRSREFITEIRPSHARRSAEPIKMTAHFLKPLFNRRLNTILELVARLAVRAALKQSGKHVEYSPNASDRAESTLTSADNTS